MGRITLNRLSDDTATFLGDSLALECQPEESPFPGIKERVRVMAPGVMAELIMEANREELTGGTLYNGEVEITAEGEVTMPLPEDFLRLIEVKMNDWKRPALIIDSSDPMTALQRNRWHGIRGHPERPVAISGFDRSGRRCLKMFSSNPSAKLEYCLYIPLPRFDSSETIDVADSLYGRLLSVLSERLRVSS